MSEADESYLHHLRGLFESPDENFHERIYDFFPGIIYVYNTNTKKLRYVNKKITDVLGFSYDDIKTWDNDFNKIIFKDDHDLVEKELEKFNQLKDEDSHSYRCRFNRKEGDWMHFNVIGKILRRDDLGRATSLLLVAQDINDQVRSHEEIRIVKELAEDNEELLQFGNWNWTPANDLLKWSKGMYMLMDYDPEVQEPEITMEFYLSHVVPEDRGNLRAAFERSGRNKDNTVEYKYTVITHQQQEKIFYSKGKIIYDDLGEVKNIVGITRDITEPTRLYDSLDNYKQMVMEKEDFLVHGSWEWDLEDDSYLWSDGMYRLYGYDPLTDKATLTLDNRFFQAHLTEETIADRTNNLEGALKQGGNYVWDYQIKDKNGDIRVLDSFGKIIRDRMGKGIRIFGTTRDVTQLRQYEHELEQKIIELDRSNKELEDFAYAASHDLQEPLRKIATIADRLQDKFTGVLPEEGQKYIERIQASTKSARSLIDSLMEFSRITHENLNFAFTDLNTVVQDAKADLELKIEETQAVIVVDKLPTLEVSPLQIKQLFSNILLNSIKFRRPGNIPQIKIHSALMTKTETQAYHLNAPVEYYLITIKDNGIGFEEEYAQKIFQMFHRLHGKSEYPGAGIGLALCKKIVEHHKGLIFAHGTPDQGAVFSIILPEKHF
jgi:PAS domain S-box-containing protein